MYGFLISAFGVIILAAIALAVVSRLQRQRLERWIRLEIANLGNVQSRYELWAEDPAGALKFRFTLDGNDLPPRYLREAAEAEKAGKGAGTLQDAVGRPATQDSYQDPYKEPGGVLQAADGAMGAGGALAGFLGTAGLLLPRSIGAPLLRMSARLRTQQMAVTRVRYAPAQLTRLKRFAPRKLRGKAGRFPAATALRRRSGPSRAGSAVQAQGSGSPQAEAIPWVETPSVPPGETLAVDMLIRPSRHTASEAVLRKEGGKTVAQGTPAAGPRDRPQQQTFQVISRCVEQEDAAPVVEKGTVQIVEGLWAHPTLPYLAVVAVAIGLLLLAFWLASTGVLAW